MTKLNPSVSCDFLSPAFRFPPSHRMNIKTRNKKHHEISTDVEI